MNQAADAAPAIEPSPGAAAPLAELAYRPEEQVPRSFEAKVIVVAAAVSALFGLVSFVSWIWIYLQPSQFRAIGTYQSVWSFEFALGCTHAVMDVAVIAGAASYFARRRGSGQLLVAGSAGLLALGAADFVYYTFYYQNVGRSGAEWTVWGLWRAGWFYNAATAPMLLLAVLWRPYVAPLLRRGLRG